MKAAEALKVALAIGYSLAIVLLGTFAMVRMSDFLNEFARQAHQVNVERNLP